MKSSDIIILGVGGMGSATCYELAKRGVKVTGIEQFTIAHDKGSSHGDTRIIRQAYFEHPDYVPLLKRAYELWDILENESKKELFHKIGIVFYGPSQGSQILPLVSQAAKKFNIPIEEIDRAEALKRWPCFVPPEEFAAIYEPNAGYLEVENCVRTFAQLAKANGAKIVEGEKVTKWRATTNRVEVTTNKNTYTADHLVITAGAWSHQLLTDLNIPLTVHRNLLFWYQADAIYNNIPCFGFEMPDGFIYGFPNINNTGVKIAEHTPGDKVSNPDNLDRQLHNKDKENIERFVKQSLPGIHPNKLIKHATCMYTMTSDAHFVIDQHPQFENVTFAAGFSGHGFKFAAVIGEILADLATSGATKMPIDFLKLR